VVGLASPEEMVLSGRRAYCPGVGPVADEETV
jgi:hypothetical protein